MKPASRRIGSLAAFRPKRIAVEQRLVFYKHQPQPGDFQGTIAGGGQSAAPVRPIRTGGYFRKACAGHLALQGRIGIYSRSFVRNTVMNQAARQRDGNSGTRRGGVAALPFGAAVPEDPVFQKKSP
ncbi:hypothetical protein [Chromobacterium sphagni]|uniref:hypothetical protein n=1 Tax=Chromobacterium sphagni TaxID=1903179 RepID=UPI001113741C|nr:hypothetical protein [Chromobacterium sphagni]